MVRDLLLIATAGAAGAVCRYGSTKLTVRLLGAGFAFGTLFVNVLGCFLLGALLEYASVKSALPRGVTLALGVGFLGSFTTFSTFGVETMGYAAEGHTSRAFVNVLSQVALGLFAAWLGMRAGRFMLPAA
jgi:CrcB protein